MKYITPSKFNTVQNSSSEYRPKLFKRLRTFTWINPVHETVRLESVVYDSDICIQHLPQGTHDKRDFTIFKRPLKKTAPCHIFRVNTAKSRLRNGCFRRVTSRGCHIKVSTDIYQLVKSSLK